MNPRPLGVAREIIEETGLKVTYAWEDLVFVEHSPFLIQFDDDNPNRLKLYFNVDIEADAAERLERQLADAATDREFTVRPCGQFEMMPKEETEEFDIRFFERDGA